MDEINIWNAVVNYAQRNAWSVICGCPPGASSYRYPACRLFGPDAGTDEPDIILLKNGVLLVVECKPTFADATRANRKGENDLQKVSRLVSNFRRGLYDSQMEKNYAISKSSITRIIGGVAYGGKDTTSDSDLVHLVVDPATLTITVLGALD